MEKSQSQILNILHFNDVYDIEPENGKGGVARFYTALQTFADRDPLIFFSGDLFSPSHRFFFYNSFFSKQILLVSNLYFGKQMIFPMNKFNITASCFGNHDFVKKNS